MLYLNINTMNTTDLIINAKIKWYRYIHTASRLYYSKIGSQFCGTEQLTRTKKNH